MLGGSGWSVAGLCVCPEGCGAETLLAEQICVWKSPSHQQILVDLLAEDPSFIVL